MAKLGKAYIAQAARFSVLTYSQMDGSTPEHESVSWAIDVLVRELTLPQIW